MKLGNEQYKKFQEHVRGQWKPPYICPVCQENEWNISQDVFELRSFNKGSLVVGTGSPVFPVVPVICKVCGHVLFFNALVVGLELEDKSDD